MESRTTNCEHWCKFEKEEFVVFLLFVSYLLLRRNKIPIPPSTHVTYTHKQFFILFIQFSTFFISSSFDLLTSQFTYRTKRKKKLWWKHQQNVRKRTNTAKAYKLFILFFFFFFSEKEELGNYQWNEISILVLYILWLFLSLTSVSFFVRMVSFCEMWNINIFLLWLTIIIHNSSPAGFCFIWLHISTSQPYTNNVHLSLSLLRA